MDRATAISRLPEPYAAALGLHAGGEDDQIARDVHIDQVAEGIDDELDWIVDFTRDTASRANTAGAPRSAGS